MLPCFRQWLSINVQHILSCESCIALLVKSKKEKHGGGKEIVNEASGKIA